MLLAPVLDATKMYLVRQVPLTDSIAERLKLWFK